ncbi:MAG: LysR family transcriptional regulator [Bdellovibrionales bacterium]
MNKFDTHINKDEDKGQERDRGKDRDRDRDAYRGASIDDIGIDQLTAFLRVVREGSFSRAADSLGIGQPAVSSRILGLESSLGGAIFTRGRRIALTPLGETFLPYARRTLDILSEGREASCLVQAGKRGRIKLGVLGSLCEPLVGPALKAFLLAHPDGECIARSGDHEAILQFLWDGVLDLGIIVWPCSGTFASGLSPILVFKEPVILATFPNHPLATRGRACQEDVARLARPLHLLRWWQFNNPQLVNLSSRSGARVEVPKEAARYLVLNGVGAGFFPRTYIAEDLRSGAMVEIPIPDFPKLNRTTALVARVPSVSRSPVACNMIREIERQGIRLGLLRKPSFDRNEVDRKNT